MKKEFNWKFFDELNTEFLTKFGIKDVNRNVEEDEVVEDAEVVGFAPDNEEVVEDSEEEIVEDGDEDEFVSIEELEDDEEDENKSFEVENMKKKSSPKFSNQKSLPSSDKLTNILIEEFKKIIAEKPNSEDDEIIEYLTKIIVSALKKAHEEVKSNKRQTPAQKLQNAICDFEDEPAETFDEFDTDFFFQPVKEEKPKPKPTPRPNPIENMPSTKIYAGLMTYYMKKGNIVKYFVSPVNQTEFYNDFMKINMKIISSALYFLMKSDSQKGKFYLDLLSKVLQRISVLQNKDQRLKYVLKAIREWKAKKYPSCFDIAFQVFSENEEIHTILSKYKLAILPEEFTEVIIALLSQIIF